MNKPITNPLSRQAPFSAPRNTTGLSGNNAPTAAGAVPAITNNLARKPTFTRISTKK